MTTTVSTSKITTPADIVQVGKTAFCTAKVLLSALELRLFNVLAEGPASEPRLRERLGLHPRASRDFLDTLVALGLLERREGRYASTPVAATYLDPERPNYIGGFLERSDRVLYPAWGELTEALRTGEPRVRDAFPEMLADPDRLSSYLGMMDGLSTRLAPHIAHAHDWTGTGTLADIGGARGNLAGRLAAELPHLRVSVFDLPPMEKPFEEHMERLGVADRARFHPGDFRTDPLPEAEALIIGHVLHNWSPDERRMLVKKAFQAVRPGGVLVVYDRMLDEEPDDPENLVVSLDMLLTTAGGSEYPLSELLGWLADAGFTFESARALGEHDTLVVARKGA